MGDKDKTGSSGIATTDMAQQMHGILPPSRPIKGNIAENWKSFKQMWSNYSVIMSVDSKPELYKVALFLHCVGPEALKIYNGMSFDALEDTDKLDGVIKKFDQYTIGETNETYERYVSTAEIKRRMK